MLRPIDRALLIVGIYTLGVKVLYKMFPEGLITGMVPQSYRSSPPSLVDVLHRPADHTHHTTSNHCAEISLQLTVSETTKLSRARVFFCARFNAQICSLMKFSVSIINLLGCYSTCIQTLCICIESRDVNNWSGLVHCYAEGEATEAYCSRAVCHSVCLSVRYAYLVTR